VFFSEHSVCLKQSLRAVVMVRQ